METLAAADTPLTLTDVSDRVGLHRSTALRLLRTLAQDGYAAAGPHPRTWTAGPAILKLQTQVHRNKDLRQVALPVMRALCVDIGETVQMGMMVDDQVSYVEKVEPPDQSVRVLSDVGSRRPLHCTALGKSLLSGLEPEMLSALISRLPLERHTSHTIVDPVLLLEEIARVRQMGYSIDRREYSRAVQCCAAPIREATGKVIAAMSVSTIGLEDNPEAFNDIIRRNCQAAQEISAALGWTPTEMG
jgi:DNA-binding IclR family transcriptional regulator